MTKPQTKLYTSFSPIMKRFAGGDDIGLMYLRACLNSWRLSGFDLVSLNTDEEICRLGPMDLGLTFKVIETPRPRIIDFISAILAAGDSVSGIVNADCFFVGGKSAAFKIQDEAKDAMVLLERLNFESKTLKPTGVSCQGFDAFIFSTDPLKNIEMDQEMMLGQTWWDYWFPMAYRSAGGTLKQVKEPLIFHLDHPAQWNNAQYVRNGEKTYAKFHQIVYSEEVDKPIYDSGIFAAKSFDWLRNVAYTLTYGAKSPENEVLGLFLNGVAEAAVETLELKQRYHSLETGRLTYKLRRIFGSKNNHPT